MKRFFTLWVPLITSLLLAAIKIPKFEKFLSDNGVNGTRAIALVLIGTAVTNHFITIISPFKKYEKLEKNKFILLDQFAPILLKKAFPSGNRLVVNVRVPKKVLFSRLEPNQDGSFWGRLIYLKNCFTRKLLKPIWISKGDTIHKKLKMTTNQGVSGKSFSSGTTLVAEIPIAKDGLLFSQKQLSLLSGNGFVISHPILAFDEKYSRMSDRIIGVVTISCNKTGSERLLDNPKTKENLTAAIIEFSNVCSLIL